MDERRKPESRTFDPRSHADGQLWAERIAAAAGKIRRRAREETEDTYQKPWG